MGGICFFNTAIAWGGGEKWHFEVSRHLHTMGHEVVVVAHQKSALLQKLIKTNIPHVAVSLGNLSFLSPLKHLEITRLLKKYCVETLILNLSSDVKIAGFCAKKVGVKRVIYRRGSAIPIKNTILNRYLFKHVITEVLANSTATKKTILQHNASLIPEGKIAVIHNGVFIPGQLDKFHSYPSQPPFIILSLGRLEHQKNQTFLLDAALELTKRNIDFKLKIGGNGRLKSALIQKIDALELHQHVELCGFVEKPMDFLSQCHVFVLPSLWEGFGYVLAEASLCKKPIVAFDISSNPELVLNGKTGILTAINHVGQFTDALVELHKNPNRAMQMGKTGFEHITRHFDQKNQLKKIVSFIVDEA